MVPTTGCFALEVATGAFRCLGHYVPYVPIEINPSVVQRVENSTPNPGIGSSPQYSGPLRSDFAFDHRVISQCGNATRSFVTCPLLAGSRSNPTTFSLRFHTHYSGSGFQVLSTSYVLLCTLVYSCGRSRKRNSRALLCPKDNRVPANCGLSHTSPGCRSPPRAHQCRPQVLFCYFWSASALSRYFWVWNRFTNRDSDSPKPHFQDARFTTFSRRHGP